jgi:hypothetical protein
MPPPPGGGMRGDFFKVDLPGVATAPQPLKNKFSKQLCLEPLQKTPCKPNKGSMVFGSGLEQVASRSRAKAVRSCVELSLPCFLPLCAS